MTNKQGTEKCECEEMTCKVGCTKKHTCHSYWCEKCQPERYPIDYPSQGDTPEDWIAELYFEVMEDYIMTAELGYLAKDQAKHKAELREHWIKLQAFIHKLQQEAFEKGREAESKEIVEAIEKVKKEVTGESYVRIATSSYNSAIEQVISLITQRGKIK